MTGCGESRDAERQLVFVALATVEFSRRFQPTVRARSRGVASATLEFAASTNELESRVIGPPFIERVISFHQNKSPRENHSSPTRRRTKTDGRGLKATPKFRRRSRDENPKRLRALLVAAHRACAAIRWQILSALARHVSHYKILTACLGNSACALDQLGVRSVQPIV
jgi:hypothetical protein